MNSIKTLIRNGSVHQKILLIALPAIISNITVPLLGLIDVAIVGHLGSAAYIGAIAVGGMLFNVIYWIFGFLRMGTSGMTAQAHGRNNKKELSTVLYRALTTGFAISLVLLLLQKILLQIGLLAIPASEEVAAYVSVYFRILIWGAPAVLGLNAMNGWFIGMQNSRIPMVVAITQNIVNILVSLTLVYGFGLKVEGVALGTLTAQYAGLIMAFVLQKLHYHDLHSFDAKSIFKRKELLDFLRVNSNIFFRTLCLVSVNLFFTSAGAREGTTILAVNTLLMQLFTIFAYFMDGFAYAGEALTGTHTGSGNHKAKNDTIKALFQWGTGIAICFMLLYAAGETVFLSLLTNNAVILEATHSYRLWALAVPIAGFAAFLWDGIFIGATATRGMLVSSILATMVFFAIYYAGYNSMANHALWLAYLIYLSMRGLVQTIWGWKKILNNPDQISG